MFNFNKKPIPEDRMMTWEEQATFPIELQEAAISSLIEIAERQGTSSSDLEKQLNTIELKRRVILWLGTFPDIAAKNAAIERANAEGLPPEIFTTPEFVAPEVETLQ